MVSIGYARVSTEEQTTEGQIEALYNAGCSKVFTENASGGDPRRPILAQAIASLKKGDTLVVVRIDRLARSVVHLLEVIDDLQEKGISFRSLSDPIDTTSPQGRFTLQILGSVAEFERALIRERTLAGMIVARKNGKVSGNPGLINKDPAALAKVQSARDAVRMNTIREKAADYLPIIVSLRPAASWEAVAEMLNRNGGTRPISGKPWTRDGAIRVAKRLVEAGLADPSVLGVANRKGTTDNLLAIISGLVKMNPDATLDQIGENLRAMGQVTPKGSAKWNRSSVKWLLDQARERGMIPAPAHEPA
jgi:DNA invertase Pin-like site-specific DNA recombinase